MASVINRGAAVSWANLRSLALRVRVSQPQRTLASVPTVINEPVKGFLPGSPEREDLQRVLAEMQSKTHEVPVVIGDEEFFTGDVVRQPICCDHKQTLANVHHATPELLQKAIDTAVQARHDWENTPFEHRAAVFLRAADALSVEKRSTILAATMLGQGKTVQQAEIDSTCETIDFFRFACKYLGEIYDQQPNIHDPHVWNRVRYRALEGFVAAISPFNFTAIGANLAGAPALVGNGVVWKPALTASYSNYIVFKTLRESGLPAGVINFVPCSGPDMGDAITGSKDLAAINFTGSTNTFNLLWKTVGEKLSTYKAYPRLVGECGGKNFHVILPSANRENALYATVRSAFEYQGQKCSACSRLYVPRSMWPWFQKEMLAIVEQIKVGRVDEFDSFMSAVIDQKSFDNIKSHIDRALARDSCTLLTGGDCDDSVGYYVPPTIIETTDHHDPLMIEEIFGPVLAVHVYEDEDWSATLDIVNTTSPYGLTGAIFATDRGAIMEAQDHLRDAAGNIYINAKSTGAVVGQQPFGGARASGTNDKAGAAPYLLRFISMQSEKECLSTLQDWKYPHMSA